MSQITGLNENIVIVGKMQSGKTTAANYICQKYGYIRVALADPIKEIVTHIDSMSSKNIINKFIRRFYYLNDDQEEVLIRILDATRRIPIEFPKPRKRLQFLGTDGIRNTIDSEFWLKVFANKFHNYCNVVIDDCRFLNEYEYFKNLKYLDLKIDVSTNIQDKRLHILHKGAYDKGILSHASELEQDVIFKKYPKNIIKNNSSLKLFYSNIDKWAMKNQS